jgi:hypothetical protein
LDLDAPGDLAAPPAIEGGAERSAGGLVARGVQDDTH